MRILWVIHLYPPKHNCGSEWLAHHVNKFLISRGHQVRVILMQAQMHNVSVPYELDGVEVRRDPERNMDAYRWADVILTHLDYTRFTLNIAPMVKRPAVCFIHSHFVYDNNPILNIRDNCHIVYNSQWVKDHLNYQWPSMVMYPPCDYGYYNVNENPEGNEYITMIGLNENKGGYLLYKIAQKMKSKRFLAVIGSYDDGGLQPMIIDLLRTLPNVKVVPNIPEVRDYYRKTRVLLMLSRYESWGRTGTEAMCNGIPVVACPTNGLKENLLDAGIYVPERGDRTIDQSTGDTVEHDGETYDIMPVIKEIKKLDDKKHYQQISDRCRERARELDPRHSLLELENFLINAKQTFRPTNNRVNA